MVGCFLNVDNLSAIKTLEQQAAQSFRLAEQLRERQKEVARLTELAKSTAEPRDIDHELIRLTAEVNRKEKALALATAENRRFQAEIISLKHVVGTPASVSLQNQSGTVPSPKISLPSRSIVQAPLSNKQPIAAFDFGMCGDEVKNDRNSVSTVEMKREVSIKVPRHNSLQGLDDKKTEKDANTDLMCDFLW